MYERVCSYLSSDWLTLTVNDCVRSNYAVGGWISLHYLELHSSHPASDQENITFTSQRGGEVTSKLHVNLYLYKLKATMGCGSHLCGSVCKPPESMASGRLQTGCQ